MCLSIFSSTTIELSINIPTENAIPARLITFNDRPNAFIIKNVPIIHIGIVVAITSVERILLKKIKSTITAKSPPAIILDFTRLTAFKIYPRWSDTQINSMPLSFNIVLFKSFITFSKSLVKSNIL